MKNAAGRRVKKMKHNKLGLLTLFPLAVAMMAVHFQIMLLIPLIVLMIFSLVAVLPFARRHENQ